MITYSFCYSLDDPSLGDVDMDKEEKKPDKDDPPAKSVTSKKAKADEAKELRYFYEDVVSFV